VPRRADELVIISWRDIPAQVTARRGDQRFQVVLARRFQRAIDEAAMRADKKTASEYVGEWRRTARPLAPGADPQAEADALARSLEAEFSREVLAGFVACFGFRPGTAPPDGTAPADTSSDAGGPDA
jgi:hypothetical protein